MPTAGVVSGTAGAHARHHPDRMKPAPRRNWAAAEQTCTRGPGRRSSRSNDAARRYHAAGGVARVGNPWI
jgi:hypothetical protein